MKKLTTFSCPAAREIDFFAIHAENDGVLTLTRSPRGVEAKGRAVYLSLDESFSHEHVLANEHQIGHHHRHRSEESLQTCPQKSQRVLIDPTVCFAPHTKGQFHDTMSGVERVVARQYLKLSCTRLAAALKREASTY